MMRHCRQCRADAVGLLGEDRSAEFTTDKIMEMDPNYDLRLAERLSAAVEAERAAQDRAAKRTGLAALAGESSDVKIRVAVATKGDGHINEHFGHANEFQIYELSTSGAKFIGHRRVDHYCQGGFGDEDSLQTVIRAINDCHAVFVAKIGGCPRAISPRPASRRSTNSRMSSSRSRRSPGSRPISKRSTAARSSMKSAATPRSVRARCSRPPNDPPAKRDDP